MKELHKEFILYKKPSAELAKVLLEIEKLEEKERKSNFLFVNEDVYINMANASKNLLDEYNAFLNTLGLQDLDSLKKAREKIIAYYSEKVADNLHKQLKISEANANIRLFIKQLKTFFYNLFPQILDLIINKHTIVSDDTNKIVSDIINTGNNFSNVVKNFQDTVNMNNPPSGTTDIKDTTSDNNPLNTTLQEFVIEHHKQGKKAIKYLKNAIINSFKKLDEVRFIRLKSMLRNIFGIKFTEGTKFLDVYEFADEIIFLKLEQIKRILSQQPQPTQAAPTPTTSTAATQPQPTQAASITPTPSAPTTTSTQGTSTNQPQNQTIDIVSLANVINSLEDNNLTDLIEKLDGDTKEKLKNLLNSQNAGS
ncbi:MAG: hypothetical protein QXO21_00060 [Candidatus Anstonellales archaeon]